MTESDQFYLIVVKSVTNKLIPEWKPGMFVRRAYSMYSGPTFELTTLKYLDAYNSETAAYKEIEKRKDCFFGVIFDVVKFKSDEKISSFTK